jgi:methyl-accepting chemotaxis protein
MNTLIRPAVLFSVQFRNTARYNISWLLFTLPLAIALSAEPGIVKSSFGIAIAVTYLLALYYHVGFYAGAQMSWAVLKAIGKRIETNDLDPLPPTGLDQRLIGVVKQGQFGYMLETLQNTHSGLREIVSQARHCAEDIATGANEIAAGNANLSQRTEQQASTLEETASGMEELAGTVTQNASNCKLASGLSQNAETVARQGAVAVHGLVEGMSHIDKSSKRMADIIGVIEGIAFQTNILALNAAVEAARAGEQGRGFAVVAGEVRALAQRSAAAAKEIRSLIEQSVDQISDGGKKAVAAGKVIDEIVVSVQQVNQLIGEIAVASAEQSTGVAEINKAIAQLESMTQQNAALVEEAAASSLSFQEQADRLRRLVARFKLSEAPAPARGAVTPARPAAQPLPKRAQPLPRRQMAHQTVGADDEWKEF